MKFHPSHKKTSLKATPSDISGQNLALQVSFDRRCDYVVEIFK